tara:strand:- start:1060 stop:1572 length:513 start_codon:yes stop_codon:yes gene_type:complete
MENNSTNKKEPVSNLVWRDRDTLKPNGYNPNRVASPEMRLLKLSIIEDGWTQPIVINQELEIVDGFHRWTISGQADMIKKYQNSVPTVMVKPKNKAHQQMSTIRHNRARGTHGVLDMATIIQSMTDEGLSKQEIMSRLEMEEEEVIRLASRVGIPKSDLIDDDFGKAWSV